MRGWLVDQEVSVIAGRHSGSWSSRLRANHHSISLVITKFMDSIVQLSAFLSEDHSRSLLMLHGALAHCGGWLLNRASGAFGAEQVIFEFPRDVCVEIYSALVSLGLDFAPSSHLRLTQLCRCTSYLYDFPPRAVLAVDQSSLDESTRYVCSLEIVRVLLDIRLINQRIPDCGEANAA